MKESRSASARAILGLFTAALAIQAQAGVGNAVNLDPVVDIAAFETIAFRADGSPPDKAGLRFQWCSGRVVCSNKH